MPMRPLGEIIRNRPLLALDIKCSVNEAARAMERKHRSTVLVTDDGQLAGIFTERDATYRVLARGLDPQRTTLGEVMTPNPTCLAPDRPLRNALHLMYEGGFRHLVVADGGQPLGVVSTRDMLASDLLEFEADLRQREDLAEHMR